MRAHATATAQTATNHPIRRPTRMSAKAHEAAVAVCPDGNALYAGLVMVHRPLWYGPNQPCSTRLLGRARPKAPRSTEADTPASVVASRKINATRLQSARRKYQAAAKATEPTISGQCPLAVWLKNWAAVRPSGTARSQVSTTASSCKASTPSNRPAKAMIAQARQENLASLKHFGTSLWTKLPMPQFGVRNATFSCHPRDVRTNIAGCECIFFLKIFAGDFNFWSG